MVAFQKLTFQIGIFVLTYNILTYIYIQTNEVEKVKKFDV